MQKFLIAFVALAALGDISQSATPVSRDNYFVNDNKGLNYKVVGKKDEHRFGVEVADNKQFHHTITGSSNSFNYLCNKKKCFNQM